MAELDTIENSETTGEAVTTRAYGLDSPGHEATYSWVAIVDNGFDVDVDVTVQFTTDDDEAFSKFITDDDLTNLTVGSGTRDGFGDGVNDPYSFIRFEIDPASDPTSGDVTVTFQRRRLGGA